MKTNTPITKTPSKPGKTDWQGIIEFCDKFYREHPELYKNIPKDISTNYKQYLYGGKK